MLTLMTDTSLPVFLHSVRCQPCRRASCALLCCSVRRYLSGEDPVVGGTLVKPLIDGIQKHVMVSPRAHARTHARACVGR